MPEKAIGMMEGAYFVGRKELLNWVNSLLKMSYDKIEQLCTGAAHCQILDSLFPGQVPLHKVNFSAKHDYEYIKNFKVLQAVFNKLGIAKVIEVNKLVKGKYQDNLEFLQWMKKFFDMHWKGGEYDAIARRNQVAKDQKFSSTTAAISGSGTTAAAAVSTPTVPSTPSSVMSIRKTAAMTPSSERVPLSSKPFSKATIANKAQCNSDTLARESKYKHQVAQLSLTLNNVEKERDFYFGKLRDIEILCQRYEHENNPIVNQVIEILYKEDDEFVTADIPDVRQDKNVQPLQNNV